MVGTSHGLCRSPVRRHRRGAIAAALTLAATVLVLAAGTTQATALARDVDWVRTGGSSEFDFGRGIGLDDAGNTYVGAQTSGPSTFTDPDTTLDVAGNHGTTNIIVLKYAPNGDLVWARPIMSTGTLAFAGLDVDGPGNVVVTGTFTGTVRAGDTPDALAVSTAGGTASFVARYDTDGLAQWLTPFVSTVELWSAGIAIGPSGTVITGTFSGVASAGGSAGALTATSSGPSDLFVARLDDNGAPTWMVASAATNGRAQGHSIAITDTGDTVVAGSFSGTVPWNDQPGGPSSTAVGFEDVFVLTLDANGGIGWVQAAGSTSADQARSVQIDAAATMVTIGGYVGGSTTFAVGGSPITISPPPGPSAFVARFELATGAAVFATSASGGISIGASVAVDDEGNTVLGGVFFGALWFGQPPPVTSSGLSGFVATFDSTGATTDVLRPVAAGTAATVILGVAVDGDGTILATGALRGSVTFAGTSGTTTAHDTEGGADLFVERLSVHRNHAPAAQTINLTTVVDTPQPITLAATDPDGDALTYTVDGTGPAHGSLSGVAPDLAYTPETGYAGPDSFSYTATDTNGAGGSASVSIAIESAATLPTATAATIITSRNRVTPITLHGGDPGGGPLTFAIASLPSTGTLAGVAPNVTYTPATDVLGADSFTFTVTNDRGLEATATVSITVKQPNIVMIMTDDQTLEQQRWLPRTNELLGEQGTTFDNFIVSYSECCPSRSTFLTGQYAHNHGVLSSASPTGGAVAFDHANSLAPWLQANGYHTSLTGKYLNGYGTQLPPTFVPPGWSDWYALHDPTTYQYFDYDISVNGVTEHRGRRAADYATDVLAAHVDEQIRTHGGTAQPFFIDFSPTAPHVTLNGVAAVAAPRHAGSLPGLQAPRTPMFNTVNATLPGFVQALPAMSLATIEGLDNIYRIDAESLRAVDDAVVKIYTALQETGELDNTIILFTSDNGLHYGDRRIINTKSDPYEETVRVPLLVRGPGFPAGAIVHQPTANIDLAPTITSATNTTPGRVADGVPLTNFVTNPAYGAHRTVVMENFPLWGRRTFKGIRDDRWSYISWSTGDRELYDRSVDPFLTNNLARVPAHGLQVLALEKKLKLLQTCVGTACHAGLV